jgi:catechol 2,3-dioxygenase-like lactoylglutathione lyase family enzyme
MKKTGLFLTIALMSFAGISQNKSSGEFSNPTIQVGVVVSDLPKSVDFYTRIIGMTKTGGFSVDGVKAKELGLTDGSPIEVTVLKLENSMAANEWKLMSFGKKANHPKQKYIHDDTGLQYITIFVNRLNPIMERIRQENIKILSQSPSKLADNRFFLLVQDPDGTFVELIGPR